MCHFIEWGGEQLVKRRRKVGLLRYYTDSRTMLIYMGDLCDYDQVSVKKSSSIRILMFGQLEPEVP